MFLPNLDSNVEVLIGANVPEAFQPNGLSVRKMVVHITHGFNALLSKIQGKTRCCQVTKTHVIDVDQLRAWILNTERR